MLKNFTSGPRLEGMAKYFSLGIVPALAIVHVVAQIGLYGDGSWFLVAILDRRDFFMPDSTRNYATFITQLPVLISLNAGLWNTHALIFLHSFGLVFMPALLWSCALVILRSDLFFWPFVLLLAVVNMNTAFFAIGESNVAYSICVCSKAILLRDKKLGLSETVSLLGLAFIVTRTYEALVFIGPLLGAMTALRMHESGESAKIFLLITGLLFVASAVIAGLSILLPADGTSLIAALKTTRTIIFRDRQLLLTLLISVTYYLIVILRTGHKNVYILCLWVSAVILLLLAWPGNWAEPSQYYGGRVIAGLFLFAFGVIALIVKLERDPDIKWPLPFSALTSFAKGTQSLERRKFWFCIPMILVIELTVIDIYHSFAFRSFAESFRKEVDSRHGLVALETISIHEGWTSNYGWLWTYPSMSLLLRSDASKAVVLNSMDHTGWQPFDPQTSLPDLHLYYAPAH